MNPIAGDFSIKKYKISFAGASDIGLNRPHNEDNFTILPHEQLFCVLDGVGGLERGEVASQRAVDCISEISDSQTQTKQPFWKKILTKNNATTSNLYQLLQSVNKSIFYLAKSYGKQMATTIVLLKIVRNRVHICHIGDSRAYLLRNNILGQVSLDHTVATQLLIAGTPLSDEQSSKYSHTITRALGSQVDVKPSSQELGWLENDIFILCTDGLSDMIDNQTISTITTTTQNDPQQIVSNLIQQANKAGGKDNITVVAIKIT